MNRHKRGLTGPTIQIDPSFAYYQNRSIESIVEEIELAGYHAVRYFVVNENIVNGELIQAFQARGLPVWALVLGNGTYSVDDFPKDWPDWQMELIKPVHEGFWKLSPFSPGYVAWKKEALSKLVRHYGFDGIEIAEPYFPEWNGIETGVYGDIGPLAAHAFQRKYGLRMPEFRDEGSPDYYRNNPGTYKQWIEFRVNAVNEFIDELINGQDGVREAKPDIWVATWSLAIDAGPNSVALLREYQGLDAKEMISRVRPDIHFLQTHWPDWVKPETELQGDYVQAYQPFVEDIRSVHPDIPLAVQADIGSAAAMRKSREWLERFIRSVHEQGYASWTAYEYHLGKYMYDEAPLPLKAERIDADHVLISFHKRIDQQSARRPDHYRVIGDSGASKPIEIERIEVDGNRVHIFSSLFSLKPFIIEICHIKDTPDLRLYKGYPANEMPDACKLHIPGYSEQTRDSRGL